MNRTTYYVFIAVLLSVNYGRSQTMNILECLDVIDFDVNKHVAADILLDQCDTIVDVNSGYFEIYEGRENISLCQVAKFINKDGSILIAISGYYADEQCSHHPYSFSEISPSENTFRTLDAAAIFPSLAFTLFFVDSMPNKILEKYLPEIKQNYLDSNATLTDLLEEIYDVHVIPPQSGTKTKVTLTVCDYIPSNQVSFNQEDWGIIEEQIKVIEMSYNKCEKVFQLLPPNSKCE